MGDGGITYNNEHPTTFIAYSTKILKGYNIIKRYRNKTAVKTMVQRLLDGIKVKESVEVKIAMNHVRQNLLGKWNEAVAYLSNQMSLVFPAKDKAKFYKGHRASDVNSGGRGRGGGPGRGRN